MGNYTSKSVHVHFHKNCD